VIAYLFAWHDCGIAHAYFKLLPFMHADPEAPDDWHPQNKRRKGLFGGSGC